LAGLDIGCGDGSNTRLLAERGALMFALDVSQTFVRHAAGSGQGVSYCIASGQALPFAGATFDFVTAIMSLMDMPQPERALGEAARVLRPGGFLQFSVMHPCCDTPHRRQIKDARGVAYAMELGGYFAKPEGRIDVWLFSAAPPQVKAGLRPFRVPRFHHTIAEWMNAVIDTGLVIERVTEPHASEELAAREPFIADTRIAPYFLHLRCRKPI
jgi:SAM-dependent methyltransferase